MTSLDPSVVIKKPRQALKSIRTCNIGCLLANNKKITTREINSCGT